MAGSPKMNAFPFQQGTIPEDLSEGLCKLFLKRAEQCDMSHSSMCIYCIYIYNVCMEVCTTSSKAVSHG